jgi:flagellin
MALSIQTNVNSLVAQENLRVNSNFQSKTIQRLTSGYRINSAGDDAAGLAVANKFRSDVAELTQGVRNANDGAGQLQIMDGGLSNIGNIIDRLKTLATESGSDTFTGDRATLNSEYQSLLKEIDRQASNIGLVNQGAFNKNLMVYLGGGSSQSNAQVSVDLSGQANQVDSTGLSIGSTSIDAGGTTLTGNTINTLNNPTTMILTGGATGGTQTFKLDYIDSNGAQQVLNATVTSTGTTGTTVSDAVSQLNKQISNIGLTAAVNSSGSMVIGGTSAYSLVSANVTGAGVSVTSGLVTQASSAINKADYNVTVASTSTMAAATTPEILSFTNGSVTKFVTLDSTNVTTANIVDAINAQTSSMGIYAVRTDGNANGGFAIQSSGSFNMTMVQKDDDGSGNAAGPFAASYSVGQSISITDPDKTASTIGNALAALSAIGGAVSKLGQVQGRVGAGENQLQYAITLAQSQITNFSSAQSQIRDSDVAAEAANLTKAQVLQQASMAAMAQANSAPQQVLSLLRG